MQIDTQGWIQWTKQYKCVSLIWIKREVKDIQFYSLERSKCIQVKSPVMEICFLTLYSREQNSSTMVSDPRILQLDVLAFNFRE